MTVQPIKWFISKLKHSPASLFHLIKLITETRVGGLTLTLNTFIQCLSFCRVSAKHLTEEFRDKNRSSNITLRTESQSAGIEN